MAQEAPIVCTNCDEPIVAVFVMVRKLRRSAAPPACPFCGDTEAVTKLINNSVDPVAHKQALLLEVRSGS